jgi:hypothetical protein
VEFDWWGKIDGGKKETGDPQREHFDNSHAGIETILPKTPVPDPVVVTEPSKARDIYLYSLAVYV